MTLASKTKQRVVWLAWRGSVLVLWVMTVLAIFPIERYEPLPYFHISFEDVPGINVLARAHVIDDERKAERPVPVEYEIVRSDYRLHILSVSDTYIDQVTFEATNRDGEPLNIQELKTEERCGRLHRTWALKGASEQPSNDAGKETAMILNIKKSLTRDPTVGICATAAHAFVYFQVADGDFNLLGVEKLPYKVSQNGHYLNLIYRLWPMPLPYVFWW